MNVYVSNLSLSTIRISVKLANAPIPLLPMYMYTVRVCQSLLHYNVSHMKEVHVYNFTQISLHTTASDLQTYFDLVFFHWLRVLAPLLCILTQQLHKAITTRKCQSQENTRVQCSITIYHTSVSVLVSQTDFKRIKISLKKICYIIQP